LVQDSHVEIKALVDQGTNFGIFWVECIVLSVLVDQISADGPAFVQVEAIVVDSWDVVLRIHFDVFGLHVVTGHQIGFLQVQFNANHFGCHHDCTARGTNIHVIQVDRHVGTIYTCQKTQTTITFQGYFKDIEKKRVVGESNERTWTNIYESLNIYPQGEHFIYIVAIALKFVRFYSTGIDILEFTLSTTLETL
jgi:hypothetical protein